MNISKSKKSIFYSLISMIIFGAGVSACGDSGSGTNANAIKSLKSYYASHPHPRGWSVKKVSLNAKKDLHVNVKINSKSDINQIKARSRMDQFKIAKSGCPKATKELRKSIQGKTRIWVHLLTDEGELTFSVCPKF